jgi:gamma-glutamylputrescine oxidase
MKLLNIEQLSYWERTTYFDGIDFIIIGAGIVGFSAAIEVKKKYPGAKIVILERGYLPAGASSKNAGFACFGSVTELVDDLSKMGEDSVFETVGKRWEGLQNLKSVIGQNYLQLETFGSWDLISPNKSVELPFLREKIDYLNEKMIRITGEKSVFSEDNSCSATFGFNGVNTSFFNRLEGQIDTGKMLARIHQIAVEMGILCLFNISVEAISSDSKKVELVTSIGKICAENALICTNGFAKQFLPDEDVFPARAQVIVTSPIENLPVKGTFHFQQGYYYFRNVENRILLGGGRNLNFEGETTTELATTAEITHALKQMLSEMILPNRAFTIDYSWAGIMGVGATKAPIVKKIDSRTAVGVRMGGMGIAIGSLVGKELADLF